MFTEEDREKEFRRELFHSRHGLSRLERPATLKQGPASAGNAGAGLDSRIFLKRS
jgi:hypothetical protein